MQFIVGSGRIAWTVDISDAALAKLQDSDNRNHAIENAMSIWQKIANCFSSDSHKDAFGHVFDLLHAYEKYRDIHASEAERMVYKRDAVNAIACLRNSAHAEHREKFEPQYNKETGQFNYDFCPDERTASIPLNQVEVPNIKNGALNLTDSLLFETFENDWIKSKWESMRDSFEDCDKMEAMKLCNAVYESTNVNDRISTFARLSELANSDNRHLFKIKIEDAFVHSAKVSCIVDRDVLFQDSCLAGENYTECFLDCPETLISDEKPAGRAAQWIYALGKLSREKFDSIFSQPNKAAAVQISDGMCRKNENINDDSIGRLSDLGDRRQIDSLLAAVRPEHEQGLIDATLARLNTSLRQIHSKTGSKLSYSILAKKQLYDDLEVIFGRASKYSPESRNAIRGHLEESIDNDQNMNARKVKRLIVNQYFGIQNTDGIQPLNF